MSGVDLLISPAPPPGVLRQPGRKAHKSQDANASGEPQKKRTVSRIRKKALNHRWPPAPGCIITETEKKHSGSKCARRRPGQERLAKCDIYETDKSYWQ